MAISKIASIYAASRMLDVFLNSATRFTLVVRIRSSDAPNAMAKTSRF
jgi:hypothetical protein